MKNKVITFFIILILLMTIIPITANAYGGISTDIDIGKTNPAKSSQGIINRMLGTFQVAGTIIAIASLIIIGMRYMFSSVEGKATLKGVMGYWIVGAILVLATVNIVRFAYIVITGI